MIDEDTKNKVKEHYTKGEGSIQAIARTYRLTVPEVLAILGKTDLMTVEIKGDLIDQSEVGPEAVFNGGQTVAQKFSVD